MSAKTQRIAFIGLAAAIICVLGPLVLNIPVSPVPISLAIFAIYIAVYACGLLDGTSAVLIYLLLGLVGVPVFSNFSGGVGKLFGPTGGYLIGYIFVAVIAGFFIDKFPSKPYMHIIGMVLGTGICYVFGTLWLAHQASMTLKAAFLAGVIPFIPADAVKIAVAIPVGMALRKALSHIKK
ncbi:MAG: biotin transporter BioY [Lachnospiraceae bacterium]|nr:biotin transporter BioY [Lachnospiraceae bacterium]